LWVKSLGEVAIVVGLDEKAKVVVVASRLITEPVGTGRKQNDTTAIVTTRKNPIKATVKLVTKPRL